MIEDVGHWWSPSQGETTARRIGRLARSRQAAHQIAGLCETRGVCVQAGGHVGLWPQALSVLFDAVYTFEPDVENWSCLVKNVTAANVYPARGVLGAEPRMVHLTRSAPKSGLWRTHDGGLIPTYTIDGLGLPRLDAVVLDVEGDELSALRGAEQSILRYRPVIWFEARLNVQQIVDWLRERGYGQPTRALGRDLVQRAA